MFTEGFFFGRATCTLNPAAILILLLTVAPAFPQSSDDGSLNSRDLEMATPDPTRGLEQVKKLCAGCHSVEASANGLVQTDIPSFKSIANRPDQTREKLANWLILPHPPMPDTGLSRQDIRDIGAYLMSLREEGAR